MSEYVRYGGVFSEVLKFNGIESKISELLTLQRVWMLKNIDLARNYFQKWHFWATHSNIKEIARLAKMVDRHLHGILEAMRSDLNNGVVEGLNNKIKTGFKRAYGFKTRKYRNTMIYLMAGKLSLPT